MSAVFVVQLVCSRVMLVIVHVLLLAVLSGPLLRLTGSFVAHVGLQQILLSLMLALPAQNLNTAAA